MKKLLVGIFLFHSIISYAQGDNNSKVLSDITEKVQQYYIDKNAYKKVDSIFQSEAEKGSFNNVNKKDFAALLTEKLRTGIKDKHFFVKISGKLRS